MSEISRLATAFRQRSTEQATSTDEAVRSALLEHENGLRKALAESEQRTADAIRVGQARLSKLALSGWILPGLFVTVALGTVALLIWWQGQKVVERQAEIERQNRTLSELQSQGATLDLGQCDGRLCVAIDPDRPEFKQGETTYRIVAEGS